METKTCTKCDMEYPRTKEYFPPEKKRKDGLHSWCRKCVYAANVNRQKKNPEEHNKCQKKYRQTLRGYISRLMDNIKQRCTNENFPGYKHYGGRGIKCLFTKDDFFNWITAKGLDPRGKNIHRIDNGGNYTLDNITFMDGGLHTSLHQSLRNQQLQTGKV